MLEADSENMAFIQNNEQRQLQVMPYSGTNEEENESENNEEQEDEESENDYAEIANHMSEASKKVPVKMDKCNAVSFGQTTNFHIHFHDSKPDTTEVLQRLISNTSSQSSIDSTGHFTPLTGSCDSSIGQPAANTPLSSGINFNPYFPSHLINAERARTQSNCTEGNNASMTTSDEYLSEGRRHSYDSVLGNPVLNRQFDNTSTSSTYPVNYNGSNASNDVNKITHPPASLYLASGQACGEKPSCNRIKLAKEAIAPNDTATAPRKRIYNNWRKMETSFVALGDYSLGIEPGEFYESVLEEGCYVVAMKNGTEYRIKLTNNSRLRCNVDVHVDEELAAELQMQENDWHFLPGPIRNGKICGQFIFLRAKDAPEEAEIDPYSKNNGIITAIFTPEKVKSPTESTRHIPEETFQGCGDILSPELKALGFIEKKNLNDKQISEGSRSCGVFCAGATALVPYDEKLRMPIEDAEEIEVDEDKAVKITLRLVARKSDEMFVPNVNKPIKPLKSTRRPPSFDP